MVEYTYDAWGNHTVTTYGGNSTLGAINPFRYRSYYYDTETGFYYLQTRYYDPVIGRFLNMDSIDYADPETINGLNLYSYCNNNPVMNVDPDGHIVISLIIAAVMSAAIAAGTSILTQKLTTGTIDWAQVGISAAFGAISGLLSFTGIGGVVGQFLIQGALGVGEMYSIAALNGTVSSIGLEQVIATFLLTGAIGAIGSKGATSEFKRIGQIESDFVKYSLRDINRSGASIVSTIFTRGAKYLNVFIKPYAQQAIATGAISAVVNIADYWIQKVYDNLR